VSIRCRFVDSISATPTVRLDLNAKGTSFWLGKGGLSCPPPPLRRAESGTILADGGEVSASAYENRTLRVPLSFNPASMDARNTLVSALVQELNRESNILEYRPNGSSTSYFFRTLRSPNFDPTQWYPMLPLGSIEAGMLAEPFAYGLMQTAASAAVVNNDPAAASNGMRLDLTGILGDVDTPALIYGSALTATNMGYLTTETSPPGGVYAIQAETGSMAFGDTTVAGAHDAAMSGAGNNYVRTDFTSTASLTTRVTGLTATIPPGTYRILARARVNGTSPVPVITMQLAYRAYALANPQIIGTASTYTSAGAAGILDFGLIDVGGLSADGVGLTSPPTSVSVIFDMAIGRTSAAGTLDFDYLLLIPADRSTMSATGAGVSGEVVVFDGPNDACYGITGANPFTGVAGKTAVARAGTIPWLTPGVTNRLHVVPSAALLDDSVTATQTLTVVYWPRYLTV
jgi:hypothetical protein